MALLTRGHGRRRLTLLNGVTVEEYINSERERITIERRILHGQEVEVLVMWDDPPPRGSGRPAPMLLDTGLKQWLVEQLTTKDYRSFVCNCGLLMTELPHVHGERRPVLHCASCGNRRP